MATTFDTLFSLHLLHTFFEDGVVRNMMLVPTPATMSLLRSRDFLFRETPEGGLVLVRLDNDSPRPASFFPIGEGGKFAFYLVGQDRTFVNYTEGVDKAPGYTHYFSNRKVAAGSDPQLLHSEQAVNSSETLPLRGNTFVQDAGQTLDAATIQIVDAWGEALADERGLKLEEGQKLRVNLSAEPSGWYELRAKTTAGSDWTWAFYKDDFILGKPLTGIVEIYCEAPQLGAEGRIAEYVANAAGLKNEFLFPGKTFAVRFGHRSLHWKYLVIEKYSHAGDHDYFITNGSSGIEFSPVGMETLPDGQKAIVIESVQALPLTERTSLKLQLQAEEKERPASGREVKIAQLPGPGTEIIKRRQQDQAYYSEIFIYV